MKKIKFEMGNDVNYDGHCDLCGRFVDKYGHHKAIEIFDFNVNDSNDFFEIDKEYNLLSQEDFVDEFIVSSPYNPCKNDTYLYWPCIKEYTRNDPNDFLSSIALNRFLRYDLVPENATLEIYLRPLKINQAIKKFVVKKTFVTYRGITVSHENILASELEKAFICLKDGNLYEYTDKGFFSTSRDLSYAKTFANKEGDVHIIMACINMPDSYAMPLSKKYNTSMNDLEQEVLLPFQTLFLIASMQKYRIKGEIFYRVVLINQNKEN